MPECSKGVRLPRRRGSRSVRTKAPRTCFLAHRTPCCVRVNLVLLLQINEITLTAMPQTHFPVYSNLHPSIHHLSICLNTQLLSIIFLLPAIIHPSATFIFL